MTQVPPALTDFAHRLFVHEAAGGQRTPDLVDAMERACKTLRTQLTPLVSAAGFNAFLARAVTLATRDFPFLAAIGAVATPNDCLDGLQQAMEGRDPADVGDALVAILANFIWLLVIFIGENLGLRKVHEAWPDLPLRRPDSSSQQAPE